MELSQFTDYSLRTLMYVAARGSETLSSIDDVAEAYGISNNHLVKVVHNLAKLGYLKTFRGRGGGIALALPPAEVRIGTLVRQTEKLALAECFEGRPGGCCLDGVCVLKHALRRAATAFLGVLDEVTLQDLVGPGKDKMKQRLKIK